MHVSRYRRFQNIESLKCTAGLFILVVYNNILDDLDIFNALVSIIRP